MNNPALYVSSDQYLWVLGLVDNTTGSYVTTATVSAQLSDITGDIGSPISLAYQSGSQTVNGRTFAGGNYSGLLGHATDLTAGSNYTCTITITSGAYQTVKVVSLGAQYDGLT